VAHRGFLSFYPLSSAKRRLKSMAYAAVLLFRPLAHCEHEPFMAFQKAT
jgi:hypothetical protein